MKMLNDAQSLTNLKISLPYHRQRDGNIVLLTFKRVYENKISLPKQCSSLPRNHKDGSTY